MKITKILNCVFTTEELKEIGVKLALENQRKERLEDQKKQSQSQFKSEIDAADARIKSLSQKLARGSEDRDIECDVLFNTPKEGQKTIIRSDTGETVQTIPMTESELNDLFINNLGAQKDNDEFVFRDKSRVKMVSREKFKKLETTARFIMIGEEFSEKGLVDKKPDNLDCLVVVYDFSELKKIDVFSVYRFAETIKLLPAEKEDGDKDE